MPRASARAQTPIKLLKHIAPGNLHELPGVERDAGQVPFRGEPTAQPLAISAAVSPAR